jgi:hypothetical protein
MWHGTGDANRGPGRRLAAPRPRTWWQPGCSVRRMPNNESPKPVAGAAGAPARSSTPHAEPAPAPDDKAPARSPVDPGSMHRAEDDASARARSRDFADDAPRPERED